MRIVVASDSFKGTLSSEQIARIVAEEARALLPGATVLGVPVADGGEGTTAALVAACGGELVEVAATDPLGRPVRATYGLLGDDRAIVETAAASGLPLLSPSERRAGATTSFGTGQLILDAVARGCADVTVALGGSATNDGGTGLMRALGARFLDERGDELAGTGDDLARVAVLDLSGLDPRLAGVRFHALCDVDNPLVGPEGASAVFGPQKGATPADVERLDAGMRRYAALLERELGAPVADLPGAGAAGGIAAALVAFLGAELTPGIDQVLSLAGFDAALEGADLCVTGEGHADGQSERGKVVSGVARACERHGVPCVAIVGGMDAAAAGMRGVSAMVPTAIDSAMGLERALEQAEALYRLAVRRTLALVAIGRGCA